MIIHQVAEQTVSRFVMDPDRGQVMRSEIVMQPTGTHAISYGEETYAADDDGNFDVPVELGAILVATPGWREGPNPFPPEEVAAARGTAAPANKTTSRSAASHRPA
jgi:hypothetical protein